MCADEAEEVLFKNMRARSNSFSDEENDDKKWFN